MVFFLWIFKDPEIGILDNDWELGELGQVDLRHHPKNLFDIIHII